MVNNLDWTAPLSAIDFLRDIGKHFRVGTMLKKDAVAARLNSDEGISYTEFSYQILQGMDFLELYRSTAACCRPAASDQWGNLTSGTDLIRKVEGTSVHAIGTPLITNSDGTKFGKSEGNAIWLDAGHVQPVRVVPVLAQHRRRRRGRPAQGLHVPESRPRSRSWRRRWPSGRRREAQRRLAFEVTSLVHGVDATEEVIAASAALFGQGDLAALDAATLEAATRELPRARVTHRWPGHHRPAGGLRAVGEQFGCPADGGRGRSVREQRQDVRSRRRYCGIGAAARPVPAAAPRQADAGRG